MVFWTLSQKYLGPKVLRRQRQLCHHQALITSNFTSRFSRLCFNATLTKPLLFYLGKICYLLHEVKMPGLPKSDIMFFLSLSV